MQTKRRTLGCTLIGLLLLLPCVYVLDAGPLFRDKARLIACFGYLKQVGLVIGQYQSDNEGRMPPDLVSLEPYLKTNREFSCPQGESGDAYEPPFSLPPNRYRYGYRRLPKPVPTDVICWDPVPHILRHGLFWFLNRQSRNVLLANGTVKTLSEEEFEALHLPGNPAPR